MPLEPGTTLGPYQVTAKIGEGGMGEVYQARDTKLDRDVALKVLPEAFAADEDRLARFEREAKVLASLNHPNIGAIHGLEEADGGTFKALVLELIEGPTLADRITQGPIPFDEALPIAKQIAQALEAAHEQGVIHRDLKPANVKVKADGTVKVLDFGLAKAFQAGSSDPSVSLSPTISLTAAATQIGMVIGTAAYMAPEQAKGRPVDKRADIWAYGAVVFEMLTGTRPFVGDDVSTTLARVIDREPDWTLLPRDVPAVLTVFLRRCLTKDPKQRIRDIGDVSLALDGGFEEAVSPSPQAVGTQPRRWPRFGVTAGIALATAAVTGITVWSVTRPVPAPALIGRFAIPLDEGQRFSSTDFRTVAISPDGARLVYVANQSLWLRSLDQLQATEVSGAAGAWSPFFSTDGQSIGFFADGQLKSVSVSGGAPVTLGATSNDPFGASWGPDDTIWFGQGPQGISQVPGTGGTPEVVFSVDDGESAHGPQMLPGGEWVLFTLRPPSAAAWDDAQIVAQSLVTNERVVIIQRGRDARYMPTGHLVYLLNGVLFAVGFDPEALEVVGGSVSLVEQIAHARGTGVGQTGAGHFAVSATGSLVYASATSLSRRTLAWVDRDGRAEPLTDLPADAYTSVTVSPDGSTLALDVGEQASNIWIYDIARGTRSLLTTGSADAHSAVWTVDERQVVFSSQRDGSAGLYRQNADGTGEAELLLTDDDAQVLIPNSLASTGGTLVVMRRRNQRNDLTRVSLEGEPALEVLLDSEFSEDRADISPSGDWIAYESNRSGRNEIYIERFPDLGDRQTISSGGGQQPRWSADGRELFYLGPEANRLMVVPVTMGPGLDVGAPDTRVEGQFFDFLGRSAYDVAPDGRVVIIRRGDGTSEDAASPRLSVVLNWHTELLERVPVN